MHITARLSTQEEKPANQELNLPRLSQFKKVVGGARENFGNIPTIKGKVVPFGPLLRNISNGNFFA